MRCKVVAHRTSLLQVAKGPDATLTGQQLSTGSFAWAWDRRSSDVTGDVIRLPEELFDERNPVTPLRDDTCDSRGP